MHEEAITRLALARAEVRERAPYVMTTVFSLVPQWTPGFPNGIAVTEGLVLIADPGWFVKITPFQAASALYHESEHILRNHLPRFAGFPDKKLANIAMDLAINGTMKRNKWELPHGYYPEDFGFPDDLAAEEYLDLLLKRRAEEPPPKPGNQKVKGKGAKGDSPKGTKDNGPKGQEKQPGSGSPGDEPDDDGGGAGEGQADPDAPPGHNHPPGVGSGGCGGIAGNPANRELEEQLDKEFGRSKDEVEQIVKQTAQDIKDHVQSNGRGSVPRHLHGLITVGKEKGTVDWRRKLAHFLKKATGQVEAGGMDYSLARLSKRSYARGIPRPGLVQQQPEVCVIWDTSGSMGGRQMKDCAVETMSLMRAAGVDTVWLLQADTQIACPPKRIHIRSLVGELQIHGRGGTDFDHAIAAAEKLRPKPDIIVYITDGDGAARRRPRATVIWCVVKGHWNKPPDANFGHVILVDDKGLEESRRSRQRVAGT